MSDEAKKTDEAADAPQAEPDQAKQVEEKKEEAKEEAKPAEEAPKEEAPTDKPAADDAGEEVEVPAKFKQLVEEVEKMSVLELNELVKVLEKKFGVSAQAVAVAAPGAAGEAAGGEEKETFNVELTAVAEKIPVIKAVKGALGLGLKEAKDLVEGVPAMLKEGMKKEEAEELKKAIEEAGGSVELK